MTKKILIIGILFLQCFFSAISSAQVSFSPDGVIIYPQNEKGLARDQILQFINAAQKSIDVAAYQVKDPQIVNALVAKTKEGVVVRLIVEKDPFKHEFNVEAQDSMLDELRRANVVIHERPKALQEKYPEGHMHTRYIIVDDTKFLITTGNFDQTTFDHCRDFAFLFTKNEKNKEQFQLIRNIFDGDWEGKTVTFPSNQSFLILGPEGQREKIAQFLRKAKRTLQIYQQYCNDPEMTKLLIELKSAGVEIQLLMLPYPTGYDKDPNQDTQDQLSQAGVEVKLTNVNDNTYMHARSIIVDSSVALVGTASLSPPSLDKNRELSIIIEGKAVETLVNQFTKDWSTALDLEKGREEAIEKKIDWNNLNLKD